MSKKENITEAPKQEEKIVTRYDRKMQKRREQAAKDLKEKKRSKIVGIVIAVLIVCFIASFPIRNSITLNEAFIEVDGEKVTRVEFDTYYGLALSSFYSQYGAYLSMMGVDLSQDLSKQMYSDMMSWQDFFQQMTVENIKQDKALLKEAQAEGYTLDVSDRWEEYKAMLKDQASEAGASLNAYVKGSFGSFATLDRIEDTIKNTMYVNAYTEKLMEENIPSDEEIQAYYEANKDEYDSVDFRLTQILAELPKEEEKEPTEAEIEAAMKEAKKEADKAEKTIMTEGELREDYSKSLTNISYADWLFDASRKNGDSIVVEDAENNRYYVVGFEKRYLKEEPTANARIIYTEERDGQAILDEWTKGAATEESFIELFEKYSDDQYSTENGLYEDITAGLMDAEMTEWIFAEERKEGDTTAIVSEDAADYVLYFKSKGESEWKINIRNILINTALNERLAGLVEDMEVNDPERNLHYLLLEEFMSE